MILANDTTKVLTLTSKGYGKQSESSEYRLINRGGSGVININLTEKNGEVITIKAVQGDEDLMIATRKGMVVRISVKQINIIGRNTQGVRVIKLREGDLLVSAAKILSEEEAEKEVTEQKKELEKIKEEKPASVRSAQNAARAEKEDSEEELVKKNIKDDTDDENGNDFDMLKDITRLSTGK